MSATMIVTKLPDASLHIKQLENDTTGPILKAEEANCKPDAEFLKGHSCQLFQLWDQLVVVNRILYTRGLSILKENKTACLCTVGIVPNSLRDTVFEEPHAGSLGGPFRRGQDCIREIFSG